MFRLKPAEPFVNSHALTANLPDGRMVEIPAGCQIRPMAQIVTLAEGLDDDHPTLLIGTIVRATRPDGAWIEAMVVGEVTAATAIFN